MRTAEDKIRLIRKGSELLYNLAMFEPAAQQHSFWYSVACLWSAVAKDTYVEVTKRNLVYQLLTDNPSSVGDELLTYFRIEA